MLKQQARLLTRIAVAVDIVMIAAAFFIAYTVMGHFTNLTQWDRYDWILMMMIPVWLYLIGYFSLYASLRTRTISDLLWDLIKVHVIGTVVISSAIFLIDPRGFSRLLFGGTIITSLLLISLAKLTIKSALYFLRKRGYNIRYLLLVGCNETSAEFIKQVGKHPGWGFVIIGIAEEEPYGEDTYCEVPVIGTVENVIDFCKKNAVDEVIWCLEHGT